MSSILHLIDTGGPGGAESVFLDLASGLRVGNLTSIAAVGRDGWLAGQVRARGLTPLIFPAQGSVNLGYLKRIVRTLREHDVQLVIAHLFGAAIYASLAGRLTGVPVISVLHGQSDLADRERFAAAKRFIVARGSARVVFVSEGLRQDLQSRLKLAPDKTAVIENGIDMSRLLPADEGRLKQSLGLSPNAFLVGAVGNLRKPKGYDTFLRAAQRVRQRHPEARFVIVGDTNGGLLPGLESLRAEFGLQDCVQFLGLRSDVPQILAGIDVFVSSSYTEGFSLALVEAMASGKAAVATRSGGPERILEHERTGLLVPPRDADALAEAIGRMSDASLRTTLGHAARAAMTERYSSARMLRDYEALASSLVRASR